MENCKLCALHIGFIVFIGFVLLRRFERGLSNQANKSSYYLKFLKKTHEAYKKTFVFLSLPQSKKEKPCFPKLLIV